MGTTANQSYPYPAGSDAVDVPGDIQALADAVDSDVAAIEANDWVTTARIDDGAVTTAKIDDGAVTLAKTSGVLPLATNRPTAGTYLTNGSSGFATGQTVSGLEGFLVAVAIPVYAGTIDRIAVKVNTAGGAASVVRLGVYADNGGRPGDLIVDAGTAASATSGVKEITLSPAEAVTNGLLWGAVVIQGGDATKPALAIPAVALRQMGFNTSSAAFNNDLSSTFGGWYRTGISGALPDPFNATGPAARVNSPVVAVRLGTVS